MYLRNIILSVQTGALVFPVTTAISREIYRNPYTSLLNFTLNFVTRLSDYRRLLDL
jgi:hypothetical protein